MKSLKKIGISVHMLFVTCITFSQIPTTKLKGFQCSEINMCRDGIVQFDPVVNAEDYRMVIRNKLGDPYYYKVIYASQYWPPVANYVPVSALNPIERNREYNVKVSAKVSGVWAPAFTGPLCTPNVLCWFYIPLDRQKGPTHNNNSPQLSLKLYPNPANRDGFNFNLTGLKDQANQIQVDVYDLYGKQVYKQQFTHSDSELQKRLSFNEALSSGVYLVRVNVNGEVLQEKIQVQ